MFIHIKTTTKNQIINTENVQLISAKEDSCTLDFWLNSEGEVISYDFPTPVQCQEALDSIIQSLVANERYLKIEAYE